MIELQRDIHQELIATASSHPVVAVIEPRQSGKTTLIKMAFPDKAYVNLEDQDIRGFAKEDPHAFRA